MPELPDLTVYIEHLDRRIVGERLLDIRLGSPFVLRSVTPPIEAVRGLRIKGLQRLAKQLVFELENDLFVVIHLMVAGRPRQVPATLPGVQRPDPAHRPRREREQLLRPLPDRRAGTCRPVVVPAAQGRLAEADRGVGGHLTIALCSTLGKDSRSEISYSMEVGDGGIRCKPGGG